ncbi:type I restriction enzyme HsdR N-terminal domain-containing protein [Flectobacillus longus]|uniref:type I restriction enzyme HsdR N-terminal domain-containing protein n=1 Tax=Flectobacillus longus TaxID=2984207 RepID=UPI0024B66F5E|nr:type I restriction enzyme HsdR N-terminal domain-containing protein [Flectobacillus longus]MDI9880270.1 type I restriction enzyme HsdR N-terminal domain-containing protein [Flectobacillus longus]
MNNNQWNEICFYLSENIRTDISERDFEKNVIQALGVLEWKEFLGNIQTRPSFQIGASNRIMPDFVINDNEKKNLFVVEIKQPNIQLNTNFQQQLFSYMRLLRLQYGVLIGQVIQVFYDGDLTDHDDPVLLETITFERDSAKGLKFVELFSKQTFNYDLLKAFTLNSFKKINRKAEQKKLQQKILSTEYHLELLELIKQDLLNNYDAELIDNVLKEISINIHSKQPVIAEKLKIQAKSPATIENPNKRDTTRYMINGRNERLPKNRFVLEFVRAYLQKYPTISYSYLKNLFKDEYQGSTGVINKLEFVEEKYANKENKRHFTESNDILISADNIQFVVSTQWDKDNINNIVDLARENGFEIQEV